jgi:chromosomal replication initiation ATPase DnaA
VSDDDHEPSPEQELVDSLLSHAFTGELTASWRQRHSRELAEEAKARDEALKATLERAERAAVEKVLAQAKEAFERKYRLKVKGVHIERIAARVAEIMGIDPAEVWAAGKQHKVVQARSLLCYWTTRELGFSQAWLSKKLGLSQAAISLSVARGRQIASQKKYEIENL